MPTGHFYMVAGKADTEPLFPDDPFMAPNRRVTITLMREAPPLPADFSLEAREPAHFTASGLRVSAVLSGSGGVISPALMSPRRTKQPQ